MNKALKVVIFNFFFIGVLILIVVLLLTFPYKNITSTYETCQVLKGISHSKELKKQLSNQVYQYYKAHEKIYGFIDFNKVISLHDVDLELAAQFFDENLFGFDNLKIKHLITFSKKHPKVNGKNNYEMLGIWIDRSYIAFKVSYNDRGDLLISEVFSKVGCNKAEQILGPRP